MDVVWNALAALGGLAAVLMAAQVWRTGHRSRVERQARSVSAWVVREVDPSPSRTALRGVVIRNSSDAPLSRVGVLVEDLDAASSGSARSGGAGPGEPGQLYAQVPPGTYYLQRNVDADEDAEPWSAPHAVEVADGALRLVADGERVLLAPVTEDPAILRLVFLGFRDTAGRRWWRLDTGELTREQPAAWDDVALLRSAVRDLPPAGRRGRSPATDTMARLLRGVVNEVVRPDRAIGVDEVARRDVSLSGSGHPLARHVTGVGLSGGTGMSLRLHTADSAGRDDHLYYLEGSRDGTLPVRFFYGHLRPDKVVTPLRSALTLAGGGEHCADWSPSTLAEALTRVVREHQAVLAAGDPASAYPSAPRRRESDHSSA